jgi:hypothetical protein
MSAARRVHRGVVALVLAVGVAFAAAPTALGQVTPEQPTTTESPPTSATATTESPATTSPPETQAPASTVAPTLPTDESTGGSSIDWGTVAIVAAIVAAIALLVALVGGAASRRRRAQASVNSRVAQVVGGAEWIHDQASLELIGFTQSPERLRPAWEDTRRRINDLGAQASAIAVDAKDEALSQQLHALTHALGLLGGALDTSVGLRLQRGNDPGTRAAVDESFVTVNDRRHELHRALVPLAQRA